MERNGDSAQQRSPPKRTIGITTQAQANIADGRFLRPLIAFLYWSSLSVSGNLQSTLQPVHRPGEHRHDEIVENEKREHHFCDIKIVGPDLTRNERDFRDSNRVRQRRRLK